MRTTHNFRWDTDIHIGSWTCHTPRTAHIRHKPRDKNIQLNVYKWWSGEPNALNKRHKSSHIRVRPHIHPTTFSPQDCVVRDQQYHQGKHNYILQYHQCDDQENRMPWINDINHPISALCHINTPPLLTSRLCRPRSTISPRKT